MTFPKLHLGGLFPAYRPKAGQQHRLLLHGGWGATNGVFAGGCVPAVHKGLRSLHGAAPQSRPVTQPATLRCVSPVAIMREDDLTRTLSSFEGRSTQRRKKPKRNVCS